MKLLTLLCSIVFVNSQVPLICYWESWSRYRPSPYTGSVSGIPLDICTHIIYAFAGLDESTNKIKSLEPDFDIRQGGFKQLTDLKKKKPGLKVTLAIGGWNEGSTKYSKMASTEEGRKTFSTSVASMVKEYGFDGADLDWEYPGQRGGDISNDKTNFVLLLKSMRLALGSKLLTIAVSAAQEKIDAGYDVPQIRNYVDFIHVMTYDLKGSWDGKTGNHVQLLPRKDETGLMSQLNVKTGMMIWENAGAPKTKLIMGFAFYGRSFTLSSSSNTGIGAPTSGPGTAGPVSKEGGNLFYFEICNNLNNGWTEVWDDEGKVPYAYSGNQWVGYDNEKGIELKVDLLKSEGYGGAMVWAIGLDDASNSCGKGAYPLGQSLSRKLNENATATTPFPETTTETSNESTVTQSTVTTPSGTTLPDTTPSGTTTSDITSSGTTPSGTTPSGTTDPTPVKPVCKTNGDYLPHEEFCMKFYICDNGAMPVFTCPETTIFDPDISVCNFPQNVVNPQPPNCKDRNGTL